MWVDVKYRRKYLQSLGKATMYGENPETSSSREALPALGLIKGIRRWSAYWNLEEFYEEDCPMGFGRNY